MAELTIKLHEVSSSAHKEVYCFTLYVNPELSMTGANLYELIAGLFQYQVPISDAGRKVQIEALDHPEIILNIKVNAKAEANFAVVRRITSPPAPPSNGDLARCRQRLKAIESELTSIEVDLADITPSTLSRLAKIQTIKQQLKAYVDLIQEIASALNACPGWLAAPISLNAAKDEVKPAIKVATEKMRELKKQVTVLDKTNQRLNAEIETLRTELQISNADLERCRQYKERVEFDSKDLGRNDYPEDDSRPAI